MRYVLVLSVLLAGCASSGDKRITDDEIVSKIERGKSTKTQVEELIGKPTQVDFTDAGFEKWVYAYTKAQVRGTNFIPLAGMFVGGTDIKTNYLTIQFSKEGIVQNIGRGESEGGAGGLQDIGK